MTSIFSIHNHKKNAKQNPILRASYFAFLLAVIAIPFLSRQAFASGYTGTAQVYVDGKTMNVATSGKTVAEAISDAGITLSEKDKVEPALETEITDGYKINIYRSVPITVEDKTAKIELETAHKTADAITEQAGITLNPEDTYEFEASDLAGNDLKPGITLKVDRADSVKLNLYGAISDVRTQAKTVGEFLNEKDLKLQENDFLISPEETPIAEGSSLGILNPFREVLVVDEEIPMPVEQLKDISRDASYKVISQAGSPGSVRTTYEIKKENGAEVSRLVLEKTILRSPVKQIETVGVKKISQGMNVSAQAKDLMSQAGIGSSEWDAAYFIIQKESGWNFRAQNKRSSAYGLCQTMMHIHKPGGDFIDNPISQLRWCDSYAKRRYGSWTAAQAFWLRNKVW